VASYTPEVQGAQRPWHIVFFMYVKIMQSARLHTYTMVPTRCVVANASPSFCHTVCTLVPPPPPSLPQRASIHGPPRTRWHAPTTYCVLHCGAPRMYAAAHGRGQQKPRAKSRGAQADVYVQSVAASARARSVVCASVRRHHSCYGASYPGAAPGFALSAPMLLSSVVARRGRGRGVWLAREVCSS
jgi:hypothetical protein